jgi:hypothetical protein
MKELFASGASARGYVQPPRSSMRKRLTAATRATRCSPRGSARCSCDSAPPAPRACRCARVSPSRIPNARAGDARERVLLDEEAAEEREERARGLPDEHDAERVRVRVDRRLLCHGVEPRDELGVVPDAVDQLRGASAARLADV